MGTAYTRAHAACLAVQLPRESRVARFCEPDAQWGWSESLLAAIEYNTRWLMWAQTEDGRKNRHRPKPIERPSEQAREDRTDYDHIRDVLGRECDNE